MNEEIKKVISLLEEKKITSEEAVELIAALKTSDETKRSQNVKRYMRISVTKNGQRKEHITMPVGLINFVLSVVKLSGKKTMNIDGKEIPFDFDELKKVINDPNFTGKIFVGEGEAGGNHIEIEIV